MNNEYKKYYYSNDYIHFYSFIIHNYSFIHHE